MKNIVKLVFVFLFNVFNAQAAVVAYFCEKNSTLSQEFLIDNSTYQVTVVNGGYDSPSAYMVQNAISFAAMKSSPMTRLNLYFTSPTGSAFTTGEYTNSFSLTRYPVLQATSNLTGWFKILEIEWEPFIIGGDIPAWRMTKLAMDFHQQGLNYTADGGFRHNSTIPLTIPEPSTITLFTLISGIALIRRKR